MNRLYLILLLFLLVAVFLVGCGDTSDTTTDTSTHDTTEDINVDVEKKPESVLLSKESLVMYVASSYKLNASVLPDDATNKAVTYSSSDKSVATVSSEGVITAHGVGTANIQATCDGGVSDTVSVTVIDESSDEYYFYSTFSADTLNPEIVISSSTQGFFELVDGAVYLTTVDNDYINGKITFEEGIEGYLVAQASLKVETNAFSNLFYFYTSDSTTSGVVCSIAAENGNFKYHNGSSWINLTPCYLDTYYEIEVILRIGDRIDNAEKGCFDIRINDSWYRDLPLRRGGDGVEDSIYTFFFGSNKPNTVMVYDYLYLKKAQKPFIFVQENEVKLDLQKENEYKIQYELAGTPLPEVTVTCDKTDGWSYDEGVLSFSKPGMYEFTLNATNLYGSDSETVTVTVDTASATPEITVKEAEKTLLLTNDCTYTLDYTVYYGVPEAVKTVTCDKTDGYTLNGDTVLFTEAGDYTFTISLSNSVGTVSDTVTVHVVEERVVFEEDFDEMPEGTVITTTGSGGISFENGALIVTTGSGACQAFADIPLGTTLSESYTISVDFTINTNAFSNFMFLLAQGTAPASNGGICIAVENGTLKYHNGSSWIGITSVELGVAHNMTTVFDWTTKKQDIFLDGVSLGSFAVRNGNNAQNAVHLYLGSDKPNTDYTVDHIKITYHSSND